jgi:hypothetical protein
MKEMTVSNQKRINEIYRYLKEDLTRCIKYHRKWKPEYVKEYFNTDKREEIEAQLQVICKPFSDIQKIQISKVITDLHTFYIPTDNKWLSKKSEKNS